MNWLIGFMLLFISTFNEGWAQNSDVLARSSSSVPSQLDRIESKLEEILRQLSQPRQQPSISSQDRIPDVRSNPPINSNTASAAPSEVYKPGALAVVRIAPTEVSKLRDIPADSVGSFIYNGGTLPFSEINKRGVRYTGSVSIELQGWFRAREAGRYQLGTELIARETNTSYEIPNCIFQAWLEDRSLGEQVIKVSRFVTTGPNVTPILGVELQPGLYRLRIWTACTLPQRITATSEIVLKAPSDQNLRPLARDDIVHR